MHEEIDTHKQLLNWFGSSKVVDKKNNPLKVYHGTKSIYTKFDGDRNKNNYLGTPNGAFFFTDNPEVASAYSSTSDMFGKTHFNQNANVIPVYLYMVKPLVVNAKGFDWDEIPFKGDFYSTNDIVRYAQKDGDYDGVIIKNVVDSSNTFLTKKPSTVYVTFSERNIKSAISSKFNPLSDDIRESILKGDKMKYRFKEHFYNEAKILGDRVRDIMARPKIQKLPKEFQGKRIITIINNDLVYYTFIIDPDEKTPYVVYHGDSENALVKDIGKDTLADQLLQKHYTPKGSTNNPMMEYGGEVRIHPPFEGYEEFPEDANAYFFDDFENPTAVYRSGKTIADKLIKEE